MRLTLRRTADLTFPGFRWWLAAAVVAADVTLVAAMLSHGVRVDEAANVPGQPRGTASPMPSVSPAPVGGGEFAAAASLPERPPAQWADGPAGLPTALPVSSYSPDVAVRATALGSCTEGGASLQLTTNAGRSWQDLAVPVRSVLRLRWTGEQSGWIVGANADCRLTLSYTDDSGRTWSKPGPTRGAWHRMGDAAARVVHAPTGNVPSPCRPGTAIVDVSAVTLYSSAVLCADGRISRTSDGGARWVTGQVPNALAIGFASPDVGYAVVPRTDTCAGLQTLATADGGRSWRLAGCVRDAAGPGFGMSFADPANGLLVAGDGVYRTTDRGTSWKLA
ncbi:MAG: hypothetical protein JWO79_4396 [Actinomycetia bacterium]|nr:hypothetical protein [Actinomycetes bacterium]MDQ1654249.1 hypothetical protein [Cryptosporangiaceae bacterium]MDQ1658117.1 hypothetical protein [Cryptosporangiaceae bacterium]